MQNVNKLPDDVFNTVQEVLALFAHDLQVKGVADVEGLTELRPYIDNQTEEETSLLDLSIVVLLNADSLNVDPSKHIQFGTGLGGSFFDVPDMGRFSVMNYFDPNWRAGGGSSELSQITDIGVYLEELNDEEEIDLSFLGLVKAASDDYDTDLTHLDFIESRYVDYFDAPDANSYEE